jgi:adenine-specific DNA-methyltransferase
MRKVFEEARRVLKPGGVFALYVCDYFEKKRGFVPVGFGLFSLLSMYLEPLDHVAVVRHNKDLEKGNYRQAAERDNFFLRGFNHLFLARRPLNDLPQQRRKR